jgi:hypothetical protein
MLVRLFLCPTIWVKAVMDLIEKKSTHSLFFSKAALIFLLPVLNPALLPKSPHRLQVRMANGIKLNQQAFLAIHLIPTAQIAHQGAQHVDAQRLSAGLPVCR